VVLQRRLEMEGGCSTGQAGLARGSATLDGAHASAALAALCASLLAAPSTWVRSGPVFGPDGPWSRFVLGSGGGAVCPLTEAPPPVQHHVLTPVQQRHASSSSLQPASGVGAAGSG
jgi:hypothetical protein